MLCHRHLIENKSTDRLIYGLSQLATIVEKKHSSSILNICFNVDHQWQLRKKENAVIVFGLYANVVLLDVQTDKVWYSGLLKIKMYILNICNTMFYQWYEYNVTFFIWHTVNYNIL